MQVRKREAKLQDKEQKKIELKKPIEPTQKIIP
jgi:hypothetical protein